MIISFVQEIQALRAKKLIGGKITSTPRTVSKSCGLSIIIDGNKELILAQLKDAGIDWLAVN